MKKIFTLGLLLAITLMLMTSCASSTQMAGSWKNEEFNGTIKKVLVLGMAKQDWNRKAFEYTLRDKFKENGVDALATLDVITVDHKIAKETFTKYFKDKDIDAITVSRVIGVDEKETQVYNSMYTIPYGYYNGFSTFYFTAYDYIYNPGYTVKSETVRIETNLFNAKDGKIIWSGISESSDPDDIFDLIDNVSELIIKEYKELGFISQ